MSLIFTSSLGRRGLARLSHLDQSSQFVTYRNPRRPFLVTCQKTVVNQSIKRSAHMLQSSLIPSLPLLFRQFSRSAIHFSAREEQIKRILQENFSKASEIQVEDVSGGCGSMFQIYIEAEEFRGKKLVEQQRMVNAVLEKEIKEMHGLSLHTAVPSQPRVK